MDEEASTILTDVLRTTSLAVTAGLSSVEVLLQTNRHERKSIQLDHNVLLPLILPESDRGKNFVLYEDDSMIIFIYEQDLSVLQKYRH